MSSVIDPAASTATEVRRIIRECLDEAIVVLDDLDDDADIERPVHAVISRCDEVHAVSRLVRPALGREFLTFDKRVRKAADVLVPMREQHAMRSPRSTISASVTIGTAPLEDAGAAGLAAVAAVEATNGLHHRDPRISRVLRVAHGEPAERQTVGPSRRVRGDRSRVGRHLSSWPPFARRRRRPSRQTIACAAGASRSSICGSGRG